MRLLRIGTLLLMAAPACAGGPGTTAANFLKIPVGARETALGGAFTAVAEGPGAVFYNPAGLSQLDVMELGYSYNNYFSGISQHTASAALPRGSGAWGLGLNYFQVGAFDSYDAADNRTGSVSAYGAEVVLGYGGALRTGLAAAPSLRYGAAAKYLLESLDDKSADGAALDAGVLLQAGLPGLGFGAAVQNAAASRLDFYGSGARPARTFKTGLSYRAGGKPVSGLLTAELAFPEDGKQYFSGGVEGRLYGAVYLRAGYTAYGDVSGGLTFGAGIDMPARLGRGVRLDYSFGSTYDLGNIHRFGLTYRFDKLPGGALTEALASEPVPKDPAAVPPSKLDDLYGYDLDKSIAAAEALAADCTPKILQHFSSLLNSGRAEWKKSALRGLAVCGAPGAADLLKTGLRDQNPGVRAQAAAALGAKGGGDSVAVLQQALKDEESDEVKGAILEALGKAQR
ncbi:MAG: PorV/PorQ family protein [Elusimicrobia bacterium]|nr:PorV/PorQ family protein [Elusimicrobiota bacterium]